MPSRYCSSHVSLSSKRISALSARLDATPVASLLEAIRTEEGESMTAGRRFAPRLPGAGEACIDNHVVL